MVEGALGAIVVGTDGSAEAERALERAANLASGSGAPLYIVTAYSDDWPLKERLGDSARVDPVDLGRVAEEVLARAAAHASRHGVEAEVIARQGDAAGVLIDVADEKGADLLVVGSRGLNAVDRFLLGSVSQKVSQHAKCTVMIVRGDDQQT
jgi:nucleotide-binding universal stress UspA family protein